MISSKMSREKEDKRRCLQAVVVSFLWLPKRYKPCATEEGSLGKTEGNPIVLLLSLAVCRTMNMMKTDGVLLEFRV